MNFNDIQRAQHRLRRFSAIEFDGPFCVLANEGPCMVARNYCAALDLDERIYLFDLFLLASWARNLNQYCDTHLIADDKLLHEAASCFFSRLWLDPTPLKK